MVQLKTYWGACQIVSENTDDPNWKTREDVDFQLKVACRHYKRMSVVGNQVFLEPASISFDNLKHIERNKYFDKAFQEMSEKIGVPVDEIIEEVKKAAGHI